MELMEEIKELKEYKEAKDLPIAELARRIEADDTTVGRWLKGMATPNVYSLLKVRRFLDSVKGWENSKTLEPFKNEATRERKQMKINFKDAKPERIYQTGNVIRNGDDLYLIAQDFDDKYYYICLNQNFVSSSYETLEELIDINKDEYDVLADVEINVFG